MSKFEALALGDVPSVAMKVHPTVVFSILNNYIRRNDRDSPRVIGTLLGVVGKDGSIEVTDCFGVPHVERKDELFVAINKDYHKTMHAFHRRINRREKIVGWYTTTSAEGALINDNSSLINDFYSLECEDPVHLVVDTTLAGDTLGVRGFSSNPLMVGEMKLANMFHEVKVELSMTETEATCLFHMIHSQTPPTSAGATTGTARWPGSEVVAAVPAERASVQKAMKQLLEVLDRVQVYVDSVVDGNAPALAEYGMRVADAIAALQEVRPEDFNGVLQEKIQDLLMVNYISSLTNTQLAISEKINQIL